MSHIARADIHGGLRALPVASSPQLVVDEAPRSRSGIDYAVHRMLAPLAIAGLLLLLVASSVSFVLWSVSSGTQGLQMKLNWPAILALGAPLIPLAFLLVYLFVRLAFEKAPHD